MAMPERSRRTVGDRIPAGTPIPSVSVSSASFSGARAGVALCFAIEDGTPSIQGMPQGPLARALQRLMREERFRGRTGECLVWHSGGRFPAARYAIVGLGTAPVTSSRMRDACGTAARRISAIAGAAGQRLTALLPHTVSVRELAMAAAEGFALGSYRMTKYQTGKSRSAVVRSVLLLVDRNAIKDARAGIRDGAIRSAATTLTRDIVNEPAMVLTPMRMAAIARTVAKDAGLEIKVYERKDLERMGMGGILGVSAGSAQAPCMIHMTYRPKKQGRGAKPAMKVALVGKGITFDSGGLSIKAANSMETMKLDKAGATAVLGVMSVLPRLGTPVELHGIMGMTENMPSGTATKPGDVLTTMSGKTIEVLNTDAEGRLVLADALGYAQKQKVDQIIDLATLTGACMVALGPSITGVFGNDQNMVDAFLAAGRRAGEKMWQLPLEEDYADQIRSDVADIRNTSSGRYGGAITAGLFLKSFVDDRIPWIHLDIAGPAFLESEKGFMRKGATGAGVRTILTYLESLVAS